MESSMGWDCSVCNKRILIGWKHLYIKKNIWCESCMKKSGLLESGFYEIVY